jgi:hypothetical protein
MARFAGRFSLVLLFVLSSLLAAQEATVHGRVDVLHHSRHESGSGDVVVWLSTARPIPAATPVPGARLSQKNKRFTPHVVAVRVGTEIEFPNQDPFFHDVFSIYRGKPFDLGLYEAGTTRKVRFSEPGVSYIFCNIHPQMSAAVIALPTPYFAVTASDGSFQISHVPPGHYKLEVWYERATESDLTPLASELEVHAGENAVDLIEVHSADTPGEHLNKYGQPYSPDKPKNY